MPLRLQVVSAHRESMGGAYIQEFAACGGTIGRSFDCDWPLPDSKRYISSKHAMIDYQGKAYYLVDLSRNGVFVNGSDIPVGKGNPQRLFDGDLIRLGEFEIQVAIIEDADERDDDGMRDSVVRAQLVQEDESMEVTMLSADKIDDNIGIEAMIKPSESSLELSGLTEFSANKSAALKSEAVQQVCLDFLRTAGADPTQFKGADPRELLQNAARMLSEFIEASHAMLVSKDQLNAQLQLPNNRPNGTANPLRSADGIANALRLLLGKNSAVSLSGSEAVEAAFKELVQHQKAVIAAAQSPDDEFAKVYELETSD